MRKFTTVFKEKQAISEQVLEERVLNQFKKVYGALLEQYETTEFYDLDENTQVAFLREINEYWTEEEGLSKKGLEFLKNKSSILTESSTSLQKKSYLKNKTTAVIKETLNQADLKNRLYDVLDEMYKSVKAEEISDVLPEDAISGTILESFGSALESLMTEIVYELSPNTESLNERAFSTEQRKKLAKSGEAMKDGSFPITNKKDLRNAIKSIGRAKNKEAVKAHIKKRAKALRATELLPNTWKLNEGKGARPHNPQAALRNRGDVVFPAESNSVKDDKDHFPINSEAQARNALARANQYSSSPSWYTGSLDTLVKKVASQVHKKYPSIKETKASKKPGKN